jgi:hypothetical protein
VQSSLENELLGLVTALETFFTRGRGITRHVAEGVAFVLAKALESRKQVVQRVTYLYELRGKVTHGRNQQILPAEVAELRYYVLNVINVMIRNPQKWDSRQALHEWIDDLRLS